MSRRLWNQISGRMHGWFESQSPRLDTDSVPAWFYARSRLALQNLEDSLTPATRIVNSLLDNITSDGTLTLREAMTAVNDGGTAGFSAAELAQITGTFGTSDTILFTGLSGTITVTESLLPQILVPLTIQGPGAPADLVISGNGSYSLFDTRFALNSSVISFRNLTLTDGLGTTAFGPTGLKLGPLQVNVAGTATHALGSGSKATNTGSNPAPILSTDQRGNGFLRDVGQTDIGAFENQPATPVVNHIEVNGSSAFIGVSRSRILSMEVYFNGDVIPASFNTLNAITLTRLASNVSSAGPVVGKGVTSGHLGAITVQQGQLSSSLKLTFSNADLSPATSDVESNSMSDGRWELAIPASAYNSTLAGLAPAILRRLFGDSQNDGTVDGSDLVQFGNAFSSSIAPLFDYNGDGTVDGANLVELGNRFSRSF